MDDLLDIVIKRNASDLHLVATYPPIIRVDGSLEYINSTELTKEVIELQLKSLLNEEQKKILDEYKELDLVYAHKSGNRFRINIFYERGNLSGAFRLIPTSIKSVEGLGLPSILHEFTRLKQGFILVTGPTGHGKTTTVASILQEINDKYPRNIITIEDPIEYIFPKSKALVSQRELGRDTLSWDNSLKSVLREDPDIVFIGEMRDFDTISSAITIAETGHLVFATLHTNSASQTIDRIIDVFPENQQNQVRSQLASIIECIISQRLIESNKGGRVVASEVLLATPAVRNIIREGKTYQIDNVIQTSSDLGMISLERSLVSLVKEGKISIEKAQQVASRPDEILRLFR